MNTASPAAIYRQHGVQWHRKKRGTDILTDWILNLPHGNSTASILRPPRLLHAHLFRTPHPQSVTQSLHNSSQAERHVCVTNSLTFVSKNWCACLFTLPAHHPENHTLTSIDLIQRTSWKVRGWLGSTPFLCNTQNIERASSDGPWSWLPN